MRRSASTGIMRKRSGGGTVNQFGFLELRAGSGNRLSAHFDHRDGLKATHYRAAAAVRFPLSASNRIPPASLTSGGRKFCEFVLFRLSSSRPWLEGGSVWVERA